MFRSLSVLSAGVVAFAMAGAAWADNDLIRLDGKGDAELLETRAGVGGYRGGGFGGGYRGGYGGYRGGYGGYRGGYGGYRGIGYGGYRGYGYGGYRGYGYGRYGYGYGLGLGLGLGYGGYGYGSGYYGGGYGGGYYGAGYGGGYYGVQPAYSSYSLGPCGCPTTITPAADALSSVRRSVPQGLGDGTFPYDGGPRDAYYTTPVANPAGIPNRATLPREGQLVSIPAASSGYHFLAFGEQPGAPAQSPAAGDASDTLRVSYPANSDPTSGFSGGTTVYPTILH